MREIKEPSVYLVAKTELVPGGLEAYLRDIGDPAWQPDPNLTSGEKLIEAAGRICYRSWQGYDPSLPEGTNPNVERVRSSSKEYLRNILAHEHGSVLEHVSVSFILKDVSRVVTHELVRHRAGMAYSQESLRYVRLDNLAFWFPQAVKGNPLALKRYKEVVKQLEEVQRELATLFDLSQLKDFAVKKSLTSVLRRLAPLGLGTTILVTGNLRAFRHIIAMRTSPAAEEEIRLVVGKIAAILKREYPAIFQDMQQNPQTGAWEFAYPKV